MKHAVRATFRALAVCLAVHGPGFAQTGKPAPSAPASEPAKAVRKYVPPIKGTAEIGMLAPVVKVDNKTKEVVTTIKVKNLSTTGAIAGFRVDEFWYDKVGNILPGDSKRMRQPLMPGEVITVELRTPRNPKMDRNSYQFSHANGQIKAKKVTKLE
jgi:hypothetical protein